MMSGICMKVWQENSRYFCSLCFSCKDLCI